MTHSAERQGFRSIEEAVRAFRCHVGGGDGADVIDVVSMTGRMVELMAADARPGFLRFRYLRLVEHVGPGDDFDVGYRVRPSTEALDSLDPVSRFERRLRSWGWSGEIETIRVAIDEQICRSIEKARRAPFADASELYTDVLG